MMKNIGKSIRTRLLNIAKKEKQEFIEYGHSSVYIEAPNKF